MWAGRSALLTPAGTRRLLWSPWRRARRSCRSRQSPPGWPRQHHLLPLLLRRRCRQACRCGGGAASDVASHPSTDVMPAVILRITHRYHASVINMIQRDVLASTAALTEPPLQSPRTGAATESRRRRCIFFRSCSLRRPRTSCKRSSTSVGVGESGGSWCTAQSHAEPTRNAPSMNGPLFSMTASALPAAAASVISLRVGPPVRAIVSSTWVAQTTGA